MKTKIFIALILILVFFLFKNLIFAQTISLDENSEYEIFDDEGKRVNAKIYQVTKNFKNEILNDEFIICFLDYEPIHRVHINFKAKLIGTPEYGDKNYKLKNNKLIIFNENLFYKNGLLYHSYLNGIDLDYKFYQDSLVFNSLGFLNDKSKYYTVKIP